MTGPLGPMDDDSVIGLLRSAGDGPDPTQSDVARAIAAGRKFRRKRQTMQVVGSGVAALTVVALGITTVSALDGDGRQSVTAAADPTNEPKPGAQGPAASLSAKQQNLDNLDLLAKALGSDFRVNPKGQAAGDSTDPKEGLTYPVVEVIPGSPTAERVPSAYKLTAVGGVPGTVTAGVQLRTNQSLDQKCKPRVEKGTQLSACSPLPTINDRIVQVQEFRTEFGKLQDSTGKLRDAAATMIYFARPDGSFVEADLNLVSQAGATVTRETHDSAENLLGDLRDKLAAFAADPKVGPAPGASNGQTPPENPGRPTSDEQNQAYLQEALGSPTFGLYDGKVVLENNKGRYEDLPSDYFSGGASIERISQSQFDAACKARTGLLPCEEKTAEDGSKVYTRSWADRDSTNDELRGESAVYFVRPDGNIALAMISLTSTRVTEANRDEQVDGTLAWFDLFQDALIKAATDPRMTFER